MENTQLAAGRMAHTTTDYEGGGGLSGPHPFGITPLAGRTVKCATRGR